MYARSRFASTAGSGGARSAHGSQMSRPSAAVAASSASSTMPNLPSAHHNRPARQRTATDRPQGQRPVLPMCYLCGQQFGTTSIAIHIPQCYAKKYAQWSVADPATRGNAPRHPDQVNWRGGGSGHSAQEQNDSQFREYMAGLEPCPHCGRKFAADRLTVHLRSCRPGNTAKRVLDPIGNRLRGNTTTNRRGGREGSVTCAVANSQDNHREACGVNRNGGSTSGHDNTADNNTNVDMISIHDDDGNTYCMNSSNTKEDPKDGDGSSSDTVEQDEADPSTGRNRVLKRRSCGAGGNVRRDGGFHGAPAPPPPSAALRRRRSEDVTAGRETRDDADNTAADVARGGPDESVRRRRHHPRLNRLPTAGGADVSGRRCLSCQTVEYDDALSRCRTCSTSLLPAPSHDAASTAMNCRHCHARLERWCPFCSMCGHALTPMQQSGAACSGRRVWGAVPSRPATTTAAAAALLPPSRATRSPSIDTREQEESVRVGGMGMQEATPTPPPTPTRAPHRTRAAVGPERDGRAPTSAQPNKASDYTGADGPLGHTRNTCAHTDTDAVGAEEGGLSGEERTRERCRCCGRWFAPEALLRHATVCAKQQQRSKRRRVFDMTGKRIAGLDSVPQGAGGRLRAPSGASRTRASASAAGGASVRAATAAPKRNWRAESEAFRQTLRAAREVDAQLRSGVGLRHLPPPVYSEYPDYVPCPHCSRRFAPEVAERHIPRCAATVNRPKPPPRRRH